MKNNKILDKSLRKKIDSILEEVYKICELENKPSVFTIANTKKYNDNQMYFPPIRHSYYGIAGNVVVYTVEQAYQVASYLNGKVDYILVDSEKKILKSEYGKNDVGNIERAVFEVVDKSKIFSFKANDLTVNAVDCFISQYNKPLSGKNVAIIGAGNIGSKLALSIVERGVNVNIFRRNQKSCKKITEALNIIKTGELLAKVTSKKSAQDACRNADIVIGCTPGVAAIDKGCIKAMKKNSLVIDVGKGSVDSSSIEYAISLGIKIIRADIRSGFEGAMSTIFSTMNLMDNLMGSRKIDDVTIVSGGIMGKKGEVIVDNYKNPRRIVGIANGHGDIKRKLEKKDEKNITFIKKKFLIK